MTDAVRGRHPGVVIYGKGDAAHALRISDHNEDDTTGVRAEQTDADTVPEHRAIDIMLGPHFTRADAYALIDDLLADPAALARLTYLIFDGWIWSASRGWTKREFDGDDHSDHIHASGRASADENTAGWPAVENGDSMASTPADRIAFWTHDLKDGTGTDPAYQVLNRAAAAATDAAATGKALLVAAAADEARDKAALAAIQALSAAGGVDAAPILAKVEEVANGLGRQLGEVRAELAAARTEAEQLRDRLAAALAQADS
ncbi:hypothetical protein [Roseateles sp.]|uniref:hypothetical protein n=1 Tax=Roseateles sp. TaxID=1971397 RepID=UPI002F3F3F34